jgi:cytochrome o ubiquinol oxidase subunit 3
MENQTLHQPNPEHNTADKTIFGFWIYLMTDLIMFAALFATYAVLKGNTFGGPGSDELFSLNGALIETLLLLTSSFTCGLAMLALHNINKTKVLVWLGITFILGFSFLLMEMSEFRHLILEGNIPGRSAFLSAFFTLVGTHGLHIAIGLLWIGITMIVVWFKGLTPAMSSKISRLGLFWHFLDIVWIFIFAFVYLIGAL